MKLTIFDKNNSGTTSPEQVFARLISTGKLGIFHSQTL